MRWMLVAVVSFFVGILVLSGGRPQVLFGNRRSTTNQTSPAATPVQEIAAKGADSGTPVIKPESQPRIPSLPDLPMVQLPKGVDGQAILEWDSGLMSNDPRIAESAKQLLQKSGLTHDQALVAALGDADSRVRAKVCSSLTKIEAIEDIAVPALARALQDKEWIVRFSAANALGSLGPRAIAAIPALAQTIQQEAFANIDPPVIAPYFGRLGPATLPVIQRWLDSSNARLRLDAVVALAELGPHAKAAVPGLIEVLKHKDDDDNVLISFSQLHAARILRSISQEKGLEVKTAVPLLIRHLKSKSGSLRCEAALALGSFGPESKAAVPALAKLLEDEAIYCRSAAAMALDKMGPVAKSAAPALLRAYRVEDDAKLEEEMRAALLRIDPDYARNAGVR